MPTPLEMERQSVNDLLSGNFSEGRVSREDAITEAPEIEPQSGLDRIQADTRDREQVQQGVLAPASADTQDAERDAVMGLLDGSAVPSRTRQFRAGDFGSGTIPGIVEGTGALAGGAIGFKASSPLLAFGPIGGVAVAGATVLGMLIGGFAGHKATQSDVFTQEEDLPENRRAAFRMGRTFGAGAVGITTPFVALKGTSALYGSVQNPLNAIVGLARDKPLTTAGLELAGVSGATAGTGIADFIDRGDRGTQALAELVGGALSPLALSTASKMPSGRAVGFILARARGPVDPGAAIGPKERRVGAAIREILEANGEDFESLIPALARANPEKLTAGQLTGSDGLIAIQRALSESVKDVGADLGREAKRQLDEYESAIALMREAGDPSSVAAAAELQKRQFELVADLRIQSAIRNAIKDVQTASPSGDISKADAGKLATVSVRAALSELRDVEATLYGKVDESLPAEARPMRDAFRDVLARRLESDPPPPEIARTLGELNALAEAGDLTTGDVMKFRTVMLERLRSEDPLDRRDRSAFAAMADAALKTLDDTFHQSENSGAFDTARAFSRAISDSFDRAFPGQALRDNRTGAQNIAPELLLERSFATGEVAAELRLQQLREIVDFAVVANPTSETARFARNDVLYAQEEVLRFAVRDLSNPESGRITTESVARFLRENDEILKPFPELRKTIEQAAKSEQGIKRIEDTLAGVTENNRVLRRLGELSAAGSGGPLTEEAVIKVARDALSSNTVLNDLQVFTRIARRGGKDAAQGVRVAMMEAAMQRSRAENGKLDFTKLRDVFLAERGAVRADGQRRTFTVLDVLQENGVFSEAEAQNVRTMLERAASVQATISRGESIDVEGDASSLLTDFLLSYAGARAGARAAEGSGAGASLVIAGRAAGAARALFSRAGIQTHEKIMTDLIRNPQRLAEAMKATNTPLAELKASRGFPAYLLSVGILAAEDVAGDGN